MKDAYYFSHDSNARHDPNIIAMRSVYPQGYGWYWILIEMMREQGDYKLKINGKYGLSVCSKEMDCTEDEAKQFITDCVEEFELFCSDDTYLWSPSLLRRMEHREEIRRKRQESGSKGGSKAQAKPKQKASKAQTKVNQERKGKESKEIKEKKEKIEDYVLLENEYFKLFKEKYGEEPDYVYQRDRAILKRYLSKNSVDKLLEVLRTWFREDIGEWHGFTIPKMQNDYNRIMAAMGKNAGSEGPIRHRGEGKVYGSLRADR